MKGFIYGWHSIDVDGITETHAFMLTRRNRVLLRFTFKNFLYVMLPIEVKWTSATVNTLIEELKFHYTEKDKKIDVKYLLCKTLYGYQTKPNTPTLLIGSNNDKDLKGISTLFSKGFITSFGKIIAEVYEHDVGTDRKLTALKDISLCPILTLNRKELIKVDGDEKLSRPDIGEYKIDWKQLTISNTKFEDKYWSQNPYILSFDIECYKPSNRKGMPNPEEENHYITFISLIFQYLEDGDDITKRKKYSIVFGDYDHSVFDDVIVILCESEKLLLVKFLDIIESERPTIIVGFNTHAWDWWYINTRMNMLKVKWPTNLGIYKNQKVKFKEIEWNSATFGFNTIRYPDILGIIVFDVYRFFKESRPKLQRHSLDFISKYFLGRGKFPVSQTMMVDAFEAYKNNEDGWIKKMTDVAEYNLEDSNLVLDLMIKVKIFHEARNQSEVFETTMIDLYTRGMQIRSYNQLYAAAKRDGYVVNKSTFPEIKLKGGFVLDPVRGYHKNIIKLDINSLYPNILKAYNICYTTYLTYPQAKLMNEDDYYKLHYVLDSGDVEESYFVKPEILEGITTTIVKNSLEDRKLIKEKIKHTNDPFAKDLLNSNQQSLKLTINSMIGLFGAPGKYSKLSFPPGSGTIMTIGRELIQNIIKYIDENFGKVIYSDTDSVFVKLQDDEDIFTKANILSDRINKQFKPFKIEIEDIGYVLLLEKKKYTFWPLEKDGVLKSEININHVGTDVVRRNTCSFISRLLKKIIKTIFEDGTKEDIFDIILNNIVKIITEKIPIDELIFSTTVGKSYVNTKSFGKVFADKKRSQGFTIHPGDLLDYLVIKYPHEKKSASLGSKMISPEEYDTIKKAENAQIDEMYILHRLQTSVDKIYSTVFPNDEKISDKKLFSMNICTICNPIEEITYLINKVKNSREDIIELAEMRKIEIQKKMDDGEYVPVEVMKIVSSQNDDKINVEDEDEDEFEDE